LQSRDQSVLKGFANGPGSTDPIPLQTFLRDMNVHKTEETPQRNILDRFIGSARMGALGFIVTEAFAMGGGKMGVDNRRYRRFMTAFPTRFNLCPDRHYVPEIRKWGVKGAVNNISVEGLLIDSQLDLLDICQIFSVAMDDSAFELEVELTDARKRSVRLKGEVRWYRISGPDVADRHFQAGLYLRELESKSVATAIVKAIMARKPS
jgi:hypothetical protein